MPYRPIVMFHLFRHVLWSNVPSVPSVPSCFRETAQKFAVQVCQVATVVMETTQLVLRQFHNFLQYLTENWIRSLPKIISKCCELVKLCHINNDASLSPHVLYALTQVDKPRCAVCASCARQQRCFLVHYLAVCIGNGSCCPGMPRRLWPVHSQLLTDRSDDTFANGQDTKTSRTVIRLFRTTIYEVYP